MRVFVTGGAGYIGSHTVYELLKGGYEVAVYDSLETSTNYNIKKIVEMTGKEVFFVQGNVLDKGALGEALKSYKPDAVIHFAAYKNAGESVENPIKYYKNNLVGSFTLLETMMDLNINKFVFSSTSAVYGDSSELPFVESQVPNPISAYGKSKLAVEFMLNDYNKAYNLNFVSLRYFNAAGADESALIGEETRSTGNIVPLLMETLLGKRKEFLLFGNNFATADGTQERDYIHVTDLAKGHVKALQKLERERGGFIYNLGTGKPVSNKELMKLAEKVSGKKLNYKVVEPRAGDPLVVYADAVKAFKELNWSPLYSVEDIVKTAWEWHRLER